MSLDYLIKKIEINGESIPPELIGSIVESDEAVRILLLLEEKAMTPRELGSYFEDKEGYAVGLAILKRVGMVRKEGNILRLTKKGKVMADGLRDLIQIHLKE